MLTSLKVATTRTKPYGRVGDCFLAFGTQFIITNVIETTLEIVAFDYHRAEGFNSVEGFIKCWEAIHPVKGWQPGQNVYLHLFEKVT